MRKGASGEEDVLQYKHNTKKKKTHSAHAARALLSFLPRPPLSCRLAPSAPRLEQQATLWKKRQVREQKRPCRRLLRGCLLTAPIIQ